METEKWHRFRSPTALGGYGAIIVTLVTFFAQGGFGKMTLLTSLYIIGLAIGTLLILYGVVYQPKHRNVGDFDRHLKLHWSMLADIARKAVLEIPLPLTLSFGPSFDLTPPKPGYWPIFSEADREDGEMLHAVQFEHGPTWYLNDQNQIQLEVEHNSPIIFECLLAHLSTEFPNFRNDFEKWRNVCSHFVNEGWRHVAEEYAKDATEEELQNAMQSVLRVFKLAAMHTVFRGTCDNCRYLVNHD